MSNDCPERLMTRKNGGLSRFMGTAAIAIVMTHSGMIRLAFWYASSSSPAPTLFPTRTDDALENPLKNDMTRPSRVLNTARAAIVCSVCRPSTMLIVMLPIPRKTSLMIMG